MTSSGLRTPLSAGTLQHVSVDHCRLYVRVAEELLDRPGIPVIVVTPESVVMVLPGDGRILRVHRHSAEAVRSARH